MIPSCPRRHAKPRRAARATAASPHALIRAKTSIPAAGTQIVARPRLAGKFLEGLQRPLSLIAAPAGFGKTTLVADALRHHRGNFEVAWLSLERKDRHLIGFVYQLAATLQAIAPGIGRELGFLIDRLQIPAADALVSALIDEIAGIEKRIVLVLDDFHAAASPETLAALNYLVEHIPEQLRLVLVSRAVPGLPLVRWRMQQRLAEIGPAELRFSSGEAARFLERALDFPLPEELLRALEEKTEGWIAGLQMAVLSLQHARGEWTLDHFARRVASFCGGHRHVLDYLADEVFSRQVPGVQRFLRQTSGLNLLCAPLCDTVTGRADSRNMLLRLEQANMFLRPLDENRQWYRYHPLFAEFLRIETDPAELRRQRLCASAWYEENGLADEAIRQAVAAGEHPLTVRLFRAFADNVLSLGELSKLRGWLDELPDELLRAHSDLACYKAWTLYLGGRTAQAQPYAQLARQLERNDDPPKRRGMLAVIHAYIALSWGDPREAVVNARHALEWLGESASFFRVYAHSLLGQALALTGERSAAAAILGKGVELGQRIGSPFMTIDAMGPLIQMMTAQGKLREARAMGRNAIRQYVDAKGSPAPVAALLYIRLGILDHERNDLEAAGQRLLTGIELSRQLGMVFYSLLGLRALARLRHVRGEREAAWDTLAEAGELAQRPESARRRRLIALTVAELQLREGNADGAARTLDEIRAMVDYAGEEETLLAARVFLARRQPVRALKLLAPLEERAGADGFAGSLIAIHVLQALCRKSAGEKAAAARCAAAAVSLAASGGYKRVFLDEGRAMAELLENVRHVDPAFVSGLLESFGSDEETLPSAALHENLSRMEREILKLVSAGLTNRQIGEKRGITVSTTKWYLTQIFGKLNVRNRTQAMARARQLKLW
jgi:LuxR family maltose regulon positive regulatory protein